MLEAVPIREYASFLAFLPFFKCILKVISCKYVQHRLRFCLDHINCGGLKVLSLLIGETEKSRKGE
jgi:hypothetical protein